jgi:hypothetical protein
MEWQVLDEHADGVRDALRALEAEIVAGATNQ